MSQDPYEIAQREIERLWRDLVYHRHPGTHFAEQPWVPPVDVVVTDDRARVIVELAGVPREAVRVRLKGRVLEISGRRLAPQSPQDAHYHRAEIYFGEFRRESAEIYARIIAANGIDGPLLDDVGLAARD